MRKLALVALLALVGSIGCAAQEDPALDPPAETEAPINDKGTQTFEREKFKALIELDDFYFRPTYIKSPGDTTATLTLRNDGDATHTFTSEALDVDVELESGKEKKVKVKLGTATRYEFVCRFHEAQGMRGAFQPH